MFPEVTLSRAPPKGTSFRLELIEKKDFRIQSYEYKAWEGNAPGYHLYRESSGNVSVNNLTTISATGPSFRYVRDASGVKYDCSMEITLKDINDDSVAKMVLNRAGDTYFQIMKNRTEYS